MRRWSAIVSACLVLGSLSLASPAQADGVRYVDELFTNAGITQTLTYGQAYNSRGELEQLDLDVYEGTGDTAANRALYIWVHGSGFRVGNRGSAGPLRDYARRGWVGMSISYRLRPELPPNAFIGIVTNPDSVTVAQAAARDAQHDLLAAVRYARAHAAELRIDPNRIAVGGMSAGGITALAAAFNPNDVGTSGTPDQSSAVAAAVSHSGAYVPVLQGAFPVPGAAPIAMYHGTNDEEVPYPTAPPACILTLLMLNTCEFVTYAFEGHRTLGTDLALDFLYRHVIVGRIEPHVTTLTDLGDPLEVIAGVEPPGVNLGATVGVIAPTDPAEIVDGTVGLVEYVADTLGIPLP